MATSGLLVKPKFSRAGKLKEAAKQRGTPVPLLVQHRSFNDAVIERRSNQPEYGFDRLLPSKVDLKIADRFTSTCHTSYGGYKKKLRSEDLLVKTGEAPAAVGRSGTRVERGRGIVDTFRLVDNPKENTLIQKCWSYDPAIEAILKYGTSKPQGYMPEDVTLQIGEEIYGSRGALADRLSFARTANITRDALWQESSLKPGRRVFLDDI